MVCGAERDGDLAAFMGQLTAKHARRWQLHWGREGCGHVCRARHKSLPDEFIRVARSVERNAQRAGLVERAEAKYLSKINSHLEEASSAPVGLRVDVAIGPERRVLNRAPCWQTAWWPGGARDLGLVRNIGSTGASPAVACGHRLASVGLRPNAVCQLRADIGAQKRRPPVHCLSAGTGGGRALGAARRGSRAWPHGIPRQRAARRDKHLVSFNPLLAKLVRLGIRFHVDQLWRFACGATHVEVVGRVLQSGSAGTACCAAGPIFDKAWTAEYAASLLPLLAAPISAQTAGAAAGPSVEALPTRNS